MYSSKILCVQAKKGGREESTNPAALTPPRFHTSRGMHDSWALGTGTPPDAGWMWEGTLQAESRDRRKAGNNSLAMENAVMH